MTESGNRERSEDIHPRPAKSVKAFVKDDTKTIRERNRLQTEVQTHLKMIEEQAKQIDVLRQRVDFTTADRMLAEGVSAFSGECSGTY